MDNEILRVSSNERTKDDEINVSTFGGKSLKRKERIKENTVFNFLADELNEKQVPIEVGAVVVDKPKLFEPIALGVLLLTMTFIVAVVCYLLGSLHIVPILILLTGVSVPFTMTFFFYRLNTHNDVSFFNIVKMMLSGALVNIGISYFYDKISSNYFGGSFVVTFIKCAIELIAVAVIIVITVNGLKSNNYMSVLLIACSVSAGFVSSRIVTQMFYTLFIRTQVSTDTVTDFMGAIINNAQLGETSVRRLVLNTFYLGFFKPFIFMFLTISNGFALRFIKTKNNISNVSNATGGLLYPLTFILYSLSEFLSTISFLQVLYNSLALIFALYVFIRVVDYCVKTEKYK